MSHPVAKYAVRSAAAERRHRIKRGAGLVLLVAALLAVPSPVEHALAGHSAGISQRTGNPPDDK